ncbi:APC family permease [Pseudodonghicola xiamenensis]|uniref:Amino acid transporter n=1 Tax=Pseudodonghicola xiamenensis TaxID=337702 RepID=A0A8J3H916_9RHOB|nr:amino acid permease [Pseudodonghicola xiamenensis]GHG95660.1 amino acid transporter [Pseudodonghicola xiamenensis]
MTAPLKRRIGLGLLTAYGVGVMIGAGIYVLVGAVAVEAGVWAPLSFLIAGLIAAPTALSYAEFSTRLPEAAGEAAYVGQGLKSQALALLVGLAIVAAGTISAGAVLRGGVGYLTQVLPVGTVVAVVALGVALTAVAVLGVLESLALAALFTVIEVGGLVLVIWAGASAAPSADILTPGPLSLAGVGVGAVLAFFAFIGFEDIVNMAEEVERPQHNLPRAILISLVITSALYAAVALAAVRAVPLADLAASDSPLVLVWRASGQGSGHFLSAIAVFAALNGVLAQIVMAARVLFGLGRRTAALAIFHQAHPRFGTPVLATVLVGILVILASALVPLITLAGLTSSILLGVFVLVNLALILQKRRAPIADFRVPMAVPVLGVIVSVAALALSVLGHL